MCRRLPAPLPKTDSSWYREGRGHVITGAFPALGRDRRGLVDAVLTGGNFQADVIEYQEDFSRELERLRALGPEDLAAAALSPDCRKLVELGQGLSQMEPTGLIGVDESILRSCHFGFGDGASCGTHLDMVLAEPRIELL